MHDGHVKFFARRRWLAALSVLIVAPRLAWSAPHASPARIGWLKIQDSQHTPGQLEAFRRGLLVLGLIEGKDYLLLERYAGGEEARLGPLAAELLREGATLIVATSQPSIVAASKVTQTAPIIGRMIDDPVANKMARSLGIPGGNVSGVYSMTEELNTKRLALLKEMVPSVRRVGVLLRHDWPNAARSWRDATEAARLLQLELVPLDARSADDLMSAFDQASVNKVDGIVTFRNHTVVTHYKLIAELCRKHKLPAIFDAQEYVEAGGLMSYGPDIDAIYFRLATYADKLIRGSEARELPIEQPTAFELCINKRTAELIGIAVPATMLAQADRLIE